MQVLLNENVKKLGYRGDIVDVKPGYFRNYLWPNGMAEVATAAVLKLADDRKAKVVMKKKELVDKASDVLKKLEGLSVVVKHKVNDSGKLYSAVVEEDVLAAIKAATSIELEKDHIKMDHFKDLGDHSVVIHLAANMEANVSVVVEAE